MKGTRFKPVLRESLGNIWRELRIAVAPVPKPDKWVFIVGVLQFRHHTFS
jgi:hypothetical protein